MGRKIRITEEQYKKILKEGVLVGSNQKFTVKAQEKIGSTPEENVANTMNNLKQKYPDADKNFEVVSPNKDNKTQTVSKPNTNTSDNNIAVMENKLITKKQLQENRLKALKENSQVYSVKDFINKFNK